MKIVPASHLDHGLTDEHIEFIKTIFQDRTGFFIETVEFPSYMYPLLCGLYGPIMGDDPVSEEEVTYGIRGTRKCATRFVNRLLRKTHKVTVIAGASGDEPCVLYTAYGGPAAPREPGDMTIPTWEGIVEAREFWSKHALSNHTELLK